MRRTLPRLFSIALTVLWVLATTSTSRAEEAEPESELRVNHFGIFVGSTEAVETDSGHKEDPRFTVGLNYERRLSRLVGVGGIFEVVVEGERETVVLVPVLFHVGDAKFVLAPGVEGLRASADFDPVLRLAFEYDFEVGETIMAPVLAVDFTEGERYFILGFEVGWEF